MNTAKRRSVFSYPRSSAFIRGLLLHPIEPEGDDAGEIGGAEGGRFAGADAVAAIRIATARDELAGGVHVGLFLEHHERTHHAIGRFEVRLARVIAPAALGTLPGLEGLQRLVFLLHL